MTLIDAPEQTDLRADRRRRLLDAMADHDLDVLVLGRPADIAFASGARQLWTSGSRPFGPACVVVRETGRVHLLSVSDDGVPPEVSHDDLYGLSWNPANLTASLARIPGVHDARRVGTASSSPGFPRLVHGIAPEADVVDGTPAIWAARSIKSAAEVGHILHATEVAAEALVAMSDSLQPGATERHVVATYLEHIASRGAPTPPTEGVVCATGGSGPVQLHRLANHRPISDGELVVLDPGAFAAGYEGGLGRTVVAGGGGPSSAQAEVLDRCHRSTAAVIDACRAGVTGADLRAAWMATGEELPSEPIVHGLGLGVEPPVVATGVGDRAVVVAGMVLSVSGWVGIDGVGGAYERHVILVGDGHPTPIDAGITR